jgi:hypothetical protein
MGVCVDFSRYIICVPERHFPTMIYSVEIDWKDGTTTVKEVKMRKCKTHNAILKQMDRVVDAMLFELRGTDYQRLTVSPIYA